MRKISYLMIILCLLSLCINLAVASPIGDKIAKMCFANRDISFDMTPQEIKDWAKETKKEGSVMGSYHIPTKDGHESYSSASPSDRACVKTFKNFQDAWCSPVRREGNKIKICSGHGC